VREAQGLIEAGEKSDDGSAQPQAKEKERGANYRLLQTSAARSKGELCAGSQQAAMPAIRMALKPAGQLKVRQV